MRPEARYHVGDVIGGKYQVMRPAMMGGMGEVYLCLSREDGYPYALKTFQQRFIRASGLQQSFNKEVYQWVQLEKHPNIVRCHHMETLDNQPFMVLEYINGGDLGQRLYSLRAIGQTMSVEEALAIMIDLCRGLAHAAEKVQGMVHRDLKPGNIMLQQGGIAKITDFGLAAVSQQSGMGLIDASSAEPDEPTSQLGMSLMQADGVAGTPPYMPPEQWDAKQVNNLTPATDLYALGCILYELLTGQPSFQLAQRPATVSQMMGAYRQLHTEAAIPTLPGEIPADLNLVLERLLAKEPAQRPASAASLLGELSKLYVQLTGSPPPERPNADAFTAGDYNNRGVTYDNIQRYQEAIADYDQAIRLDPSFALAYSNRGSSYGDLGQHERAIADFDQAIRLDPSFAKAYVNRGNSYAGLGQHQRAIADFDQALRLDPSLAQVYSNRGNSYRALGQLERAIADHDQAIRLDPSLAPAYYNRGNSYYELGQHERAIADYDQAIRLDPSYAPAYYNRGNRYGDLGQLERAIADYDQAIRLDPSLAPAYSNRGLSYAALGQLERAIADYDQAIRLDPSYANAYFNKGAALANNGQLAEALPLLEKALALGDADAAGAIRQVKQMMGQPSQVPASGASQLDPAQAAFEAFQQAQSVEDMVKAVQQYPFMSDPQFIQQIEQVIQQQVPPEQRPYFEERLAVLKQIADQVRGE